MGGLLQSVKHDGESAMKLLSAGFSRAAEDPKGTFGHAMGAANRSMMQFSHGMSDQAMGQASRMRNSASGVMSGMHDNAQGMAAGAARSGAHLMVDAAMAAEARKLGRDS